MRIMFLLGMCSDQGLSRLCSVCLGSMDSRSLDSPWQMLAQRGGILYVLWGAFAGPAERLGP